MKIRKQIFKNIIIYLLLVLGYLYLYVVDIDSILYPTNEVKVQSKVNFIYQQF